MLFILFSWLISLANISGSMLNRSGESGYSCPLPSVQGKAFSFSPLVWCYLWIFWRYCCLSSWASSLLLLVCWKFLSWMCVDLSQYLFCIIRLHVSLFTLFLMINDGYISPIYWPFYHLPVWMFNCFAHLKRIFLFCNIDKLSEKI